MRTLLPRRLYRPNPVTLSLCCPCAKYAVSLCPSVMRLSTVLFLEPKNRDVCTYLYEKMFYLQDVHVWKTKTQTGRVLHKIEWLTKITKQLIIAQAIKQQPFDKYNTTKFQVLWAFCSSENTVSKKRVCLHSTHSHLKAYKYYRFTFWCEMLDTFISSSL